MKVKTSFHTNDDGSRTYTKIFKGRGVTCICKETIWDNDTDDCNDTDNIFDMFTIKKVDKSKKKIDNKEDVLKDLDIGLDDDIPILIYDDELPGITIGELEDLRDNLFTILSKGDNANRLIKFLISMKDEMGDEDVEKGKR